MLRSHKVPCLLRYELLTLGDVSPVDLAHVAYLLAFIAVGLVAARFTYTRRLSV